MKSSFAPAPPGSSGASIHKVLQNLLLNSRSSDCTSPITPPPHRSNDNSSSSSSSSPPSSTDSDQMDAMTLHDLTSSSSSQSSIDTMTQSVSAESNPSFMLSIAQLALGIGVAFLFDSWWRRRRNTNNSNPNPIPDEEQPSTQAGSSQRLRTQESIESLRAQRSPSDATTPLLDNADSSQHSFSEHNVNTVDNDNVVRSNIVKLPSSPIKSDQTSPSSIEHETSPNANSSSSNNDDSPAETNGPIENEIVSTRLSQPQVSTPQEQIEIFRNESFGKTNGNVTDGADAQPETSTNEIANDDTYAQPEASGMITNENTINEATELKESNVSTTASVLNADNIPIATKKTPEPIEAAFQPIQSQTPSLAQQGNGMESGPLPKDVAIGQAQREVEVAMEDEATLSGKEAGVGKGQICVSQLVVYPIKGCTGISVDSVCLTSLGLERDRRMVVTDFTGRALNQKRYPILAQVIVSYMPNGDIELKQRTKLENRAEFTPRDTGTEVRKVRHVNGAELEAIDQGEHAAQFFASLMEIAGVRLVHLKQGSAHNGVEGAKAYTSPFSDEFPLLVASQRSVDQVNEWVGGEVEVGADRFRPNILLDTTPKNTLKPFEEDEWDVLSIGEKKVNVQLLTKCARCKVISVNQETAEHTPVVLRTLFKHRKEGSAANFARNATPVNAPVLSKWNDRQKKDAFVISVGDVVEVTSRL